MKKTLALILSIFMLAAMLVACGSETPTTDDNDNNSASDESTDNSTPRITYKELNDGSYTIENMQVAEGREPDATTETSDGTALYLYNNVAFESVTFTQVQYTFTEERNKIACTITAEDELDAQQETLLTLMTDLYGTPTQSQTSDGDTIYTWRDSTQNFVTLMKVNDKTVQLAFNFIKSA